MLGVRVCHFSASCDEILNANLHPHGSSTCLLMSCLVQTFFFHFLGTCLWYLSCSSLFLHVLIHNSDSGKSWHLCGFLKVSWNKKQLCCLFRRRVWLYRVCVSMEKARFFIVFAHDRCVLCDACIGVRSGCCQCSMSYVLASAMGFASC